MDDEWAVRRLKEFIRLTTLRWHESGELGSYSELSGQMEEIVQSAQIVEKILDRVTPTWRRDLADDPSHEWQPTAVAAMRALSEIENSAEVAEKLGEDAPFMKADAMHPWAWDAARSLWQSRHFGEAVRAATVKINAELQNKLSRRDVSEIALFQQAFSSDQPTVGALRLRPVGDDDGKTALSVRRGIVALAEGCFAAIRNPASHDSVEGISEQLALEQLAVVSLLARWIDECVVVSA